MTWQNTKLLLRISRCLHTVGLEFPWFAATVSSLVDSLYYENVPGATLESMHSVVVLFDVWYYHPAISRVTQTYRPDKQNKSTITKAFVELGLFSVLQIKK